MHNALKCLKTRLLELINFFVHLVIYQLLLDDAAQHDIILPFDGTKLQNESFFIKIS